MFDKLSFSTGSFSDSSWDFDGVAKDFCSSWGNSWFNSWKSSWGRLEDNKDGRSGYWRLFYHQMQEEALKEKPSKRVKVYKEKFKYTELKDGSVVVSELNTQTKPPIKLKPVESNLANESIKLPTPKEQVTNFLSEAQRVADDVTYLLARYKISVKYHQLDVANDEDDIELLLLVA